MLQALGQFGARGLPCLVRPQSQPLPEHFPQSPEGNAIPVRDAPAAMPGHFGKSIGHMSFELRDEPTLSDARLPADRDQSRPSVCQSRFEQAAEAG